MTINAVIKTLDERIEEADHASITVAEQLAMSRAEVVELRAALAAAQATPEGADLPPLKALEELIGAIEEDYAETWLRQREATIRAALAATTAADMPPPKYASVMAIADEFGSGAVAYTADEVRAALAAQQNSASNSSNNSASQQAEPVAQYRPKRPADSPWHDVIKGRPCILPDDLYEVRTLYRAAPPQQIEPLCCNHNCNQGRDCPYRKGEQQ